MKKLKTQYNLPVIERTTNAINERLLFLINSVEFYGRKFDKFDAIEVKEMLNVLKDRKQKTKHALRVKKILKIQAV
jgi:hypothetical protein